jgi:hypothetical protein
MALAGYTQQKTALKKVFKVGGFLIGYTSSFRMGQILQHHLDVPEQDPSMPDEKYMVTVFIEAVRGVLKDFGYTKVDSNKEENGTFLVGYKDKLHYVGSDLQLNRTTNGIDSVGAGNEFAMGALLATPKMKPKKRILKALKIAGKLSCAVLEPYYVEHTNG